MAENGGTLGEEEEEEESIAGEGSTTGSDHGEGREYDTLNGEFWLPEWKENWGCT